MVVKFHICLQLLCTTKSTPPRKSQQYKTHGREKPNPALGEIDICTSLLCMHLLFASPLACRAAARCLTAAATQPNARGDKTSSAMYACTTDMQKRLDCQLAKENLAKESLCSMVVDCLVKRMRNYCTTVHTTHHTRRRLLGGSRFTIVTRLSVTFSSCGVI